MKMISFLHPVRTALWLLGLAFLPGSIMAQDHWSQVPPFTTQCYSDQDSFRQTVDDLRFKFKEKIETINKADAEKANTITDQEKMVFAMRYQNMSPEEIVNMQNEMMEMTTSQADFAEKASAIEIRYNELESEFRNEFATRLAPIENETRDLPDGEGTPQWAIEKAEELMAQYNQEYESLCETYFTSPNAKFRTWLDDFHKFLIDEEIPYNEKMLKMQYAQFGLDPDISSVTLAAVERYLVKNSSISGLRRPHPQGG